MSSTLAVHPNRKLLSSRFGGLKSLAPPLVRWCDGVSENLQLAGSRPVGCPTFRPSLNFPKSGLGIVCRASLDPHLECLLSVLKVP